ncbi:Uncharacterised protein [Klebsiella pneumoniae]|uniref:Uncharacterized protein n=1 Tax=Klebsiella pneumoniae TaxID=573 RepID=A0A377WDS2_KLEPN|nr:MULTISPECIES: hypothetical protein [Klebsiella]MDU5052844.1 hypothetical protein [Klebsiella variicola]ESL54648.1 hypothetical protein L461_00274 [Klebsiella pneumoniae BIDMC 25]KFJ72101.1 hypothetical protein DR88_408 [Klebsiella pneumoniae]KHF68920.1 hypothetical protein LV59_02565 [Klebsiella pneumoniae]MBZ7053533.1 hypothetical protein [Klebsiella quasipneumoniae]
MTLNSIRNALFAAMHGLSVEQYELQKARDNLKSVTDDFLDQHPEYLRERFAEGKPATELELLKSAPVDDGTFTPHIIDEGTLERARVKCREVVASDPDRYSHIIESSPLRAG